MMRTLTFAAAMIALTGTASASCVLSTSPCSTDSYGNTYRTDQNLGGGYTTRRNGNTYSTTTQTLSGGYREDFSAGGTRSYDSDPYGNGRSNSGSYQPFKTYDPTGGRFGLGDD